MAAYRPASSYLYCTACSAEPQPLTLWGRLGADMACQEDSQLLGAEISSTTTYYGALICPCIIWQSRWRRGQKDMLHFVCQVRNQCFKGRSVRLMGPEEEKVEKIVLRGGFLTSAEDYSALPMRLLQYTSSAAMPTRPVREVRPRYVVETRAGFYGITSVMVPFGSN